MNSQDWIYLEEGGAHILFTHEGTDKRFVGKVLRLTKTNHQVDGSALAKAKQLQDLYYKFILDEYIGAGYAAYLNQIDVTPQFIESLSSECKDQRPVHRLIKDLDPNVSYGHLIDNLMSPAYDYAVEIKPKWGLACDEASRQLCKFCRLQGTKSYQVGDYCPVLLFSGNADGIKEAIEALVKAPRNQLRMFYKGKRVQSHEAAKSRLVQILAEDPILSKLKEAQERLFQIYRHEIISIEGLTEDYLADLENEMRSGILSSPLAAFLAAISIEDASLMIAFNQHDTSYQIKLIDVDIKLPKKLEEYIAEHDYLRI